MDKDTLHIGFDAKRVVCNGTGLGSFGRTLVNDLSKDATLSLSLYAPTAGRADLRAQLVQRPNVRLVCAHGWPTALGRALWRTRGVVSQLVADGVHVYHGLSGELPMGLRRRGVRTVVTIHDLIFLRHPEYYHWADTRLYAWKFRQALREADRVVAISECTRRDIAELGGLAPERIDVVYQGWAPRFAPVADAAVLHAAARRYQLPECFVLSVGTIEPRKNLLLAVKALHHLPAHVHLVAVGRATSYAREVADYARRHALDHRLHLLHGVPDADLPALYALAETFVYPSRYEGFGIPIVEAVSCGLPVVACTGSCLEEAGGPDCLYVGPDDAEALADALGHAAKSSDEGRRRAAAARRYIGRFEGTDVARQYTHIYRELC